MTEEKDIHEISDVSSIKVAFRTRYVVTVDGESNKFGSEEKAVAFRNEQLALRREQQERREAARRAEGIKAEETRVRAEYDQDPDYFTITVQPPLRPPPEETDVRSSARVDLEAYSREIDTACFRLARFGYEVISITPLISGFADSNYRYKVGGDRNGNWAYGWGAGWGFSYTDGVVIVGRKKRQGAEPSEAPATG